MKHIIRNCLLLFFPLVFLSCSSLSYREAYPILSDNKYDSEFPYHSCSDQLAEISESIKMINCITYYKIYIFKDGLGIKKQDLKNIALNDITAYTKHTERTSSGTGTVILKGLNKLALLTCAHVVSFVDTIYSFQSDSIGNYNQYLNGILIKEREDIYVPDLPEDGALKVLCLDNSLDVAILGQEISNTANISVQKFNYPFGRARNLEWGTFVYLFGYPMGYKTLTKALISSPNRDKNGSFILDANFNEGFSGGIILAIKDGVPNFELVGMVKSMFGDIEYILKPSDNFNYSKHNPLFPYSGELFVDKRLNVKYGVAKAIPVESIIEFIFTNKVLLNNLGYDFSEFLNKNL
jgi:hypothetical protein